MNMVVRIIGIAMLLMGGWRVWNIVISFLHAISNLHYIEITLFAVIHIMVFEILMVLNLVLNSLMIVLGMGVVRLKHNAVRWAVPLLFVMFVFISCTGTATIAASNYTSVALSLAPDVIHEMRLYGFLYIVVASLLLLFAGILRIYYKKSK